MAVTTSISLECDMSRLDQPGARTKLRRCVPEGWIAKRAKMKAMETPTTACATFGRATAIPPTADVTETAGLYL